MEQSYPQPASRNAISAQGIASKVNESPKQIGPDGKSAGAPAATKSITAGGKPPSGFQGGVIEGKV